jgi:hypothetical protein
LFMCHIYKMGTTRSIIKYDFPTHLLPEKRALLMGFDYSGVNKLNGTVGDITLAKSTLINDYQFLDQNIYSFTDGDIYSLLLSFINSSIAGDVNYIHYSGHANNNGQSDYLINEDLSIITNNEISNLFSKAENRTFVFVVDACDSGAIFDLPFDFTDSGVKMLNNKTINSNIISISSSADTQLSFESEHASVGVFGNFSYVFYNYIGDHPESTWIQAIQEVRKQLKDQYPELSVSKEYLMYATIGSIL